MCLLRLPSQNPKVHSSMMHSIQKKSSKLLLNIFVVFGFIDSFTHDAFFIHLFSVASSVLLACEEKSSRQKS